MRFKHAFLVRNFTLNRIASQGYSKEWERENLEIRVGTMRLTRQH